MNQCLKELRYDQSLRGPLATLSEVLERFQDPDKQMEGGKGVLRTF